MNEPRAKIKQLEVMVAERIEEAHDTVTLVLFTGNDTLNYQPGHFLTIEPHQFPGLQRWVHYLEDVKGKKEPPRAYSMASSPDEKYLAITIKEERYTSGATPYPPLLSPILVMRTLPGARMVITGFTGPYTLTDKIRNESEHIVHVCAGSGVVPSFSIIKHDLRVNEKLKHTLIFSNKLMADAIFFQQFEELRRQHPDRFEVIYTLTREQDESLFNDRIHKGRVSKQLLQDIIPSPEGVTVFACGPDHTVWQRKAARETGAELSPSYLGSVLSYLDELGIAKNRIRKESYG